MLWYWKFILKNTHQENSRKTQQDLFVITDKKKKKNTSVNSLISENNHWEKREPLWRQKSGREPGACHHALLLQGQGTHGPPATEDESKPAPRLPRHCCGSQMETPLESLLGSISNRDPEQPRLPAARGCEQGLAPVPGPLAGQGASPGVYRIKQSNVLETTLEPESSCYLSHLDTCEVHC